MSKKKTQLDHAIEALELDLRDVKRAHQAERAELDAKFAGRIDGMENSLARLRNERSRTPKRRTRKQESPAALATQQG